MCGIGAILDPAGTSGQHAAERMVEALRHRGPDGEALRRIGPVALAHTRLAIIDVAGGDQPLDSEDGQVTAIVNGEIYNHRALRAELEQRGHRWATELGQRGRRARLRGARRWTSSAGLNGIFAFVIWDDREQRLVAARDAVRSEAAVLVDGRPPRGARLRDRRADRRRPGHPGAWTASRSTTTWPAASYPSPRTLFEGVRKLPAASTLVVEGGGAPRVDELARGAGRPDRAAPTRSSPTGSPSAFDDAVERQMMSDVPYGAFLSGRRGQRGSRGRDEATRSGTPPTTFTIGFPGHGDVLDERALAAESARIIGTDHHDTVMRETDFLDRARALHAAAGGALRHPERARAAPALALRGPAR